MKIYVNTKNQPPTLAATFSSKTDATGELRVYSSSFGSGISSLRFKRGTVVPFELAFPAAEGFSPPTKVRFGLKPAGQYDAALATFAESENSKTEDDGTLVFSMNAEIASALIDAQLGVGGSGTADDKATASFVAEFAWEDADGNTVATTTVPATVENNVIRDGDAAAGVNPGGSWAALMVVRMAWADYCALEDKNPDAIYVVPDAPSEIDEHNLDEAAHPALVQALTQMIQTFLGDLQLDDETATRILTELSEVRAAASAASADAAAVRTSMNTDFAKFEAGTSTAETGAKHGKSLLASQNGEHGGFYVGANRATTRSWTQYMTLYQQTGVRAYGETNGAGEDYLWSPRTAEDEPLRVARMKDIPAPGGTLTVDAGNELKMAGALRWLDGEGNAAVSLRFTDSPTGGVLNQGSASTTTAMTWMSGNYMSWFSSERLRMYSGYSSESEISPTSKIEANPNGVILAAGANDATKIVIDAGKIQVGGVALTLNVAPTATNQGRRAGSENRGAGGARRRVGRSVRRWRTLRSKSASSGASPAPSRRSSRRPPESRSKWTPPARSTARNAASSLIGITTSEPRTKKSSPTRKPPPRRSATRRRGSTR